MKPWFVIVAAKVVIILKPRIIWRQKFRKKSNLRPSQLHFVAPGPAGIPFCRRGCGCCDNGRLPLTFCQTKVATVPFLASKCSFVDFVAFWSDSQNTPCRSFALEDVLPESLSGRNPFRLTPDADCTVQNETFRFVDATHLPANETCTFCISFSEDLTFTDETIWFGEVKLYCLTSQTLVFRRSNDIV